MLCLLCCGGVCCVAWYLILWMLFFNVHTFLLFVLPYFLLAMFVFFIAILFKIPLYFMWYNTIIIQQKIKNKLQSHKNKNKETIQNAPKRNTTKRTKNDS